MNQGLLSCCYAIGLILSCWAVLLSSFIGIGSLIARFFSIQEYWSDIVISYFWVGWASTIFFLQIWHLFFKVDGYAFILVTLVGLIGIISNREKFLTLIKTIKFTTIISFGVLFFVIIWLANSARFSPLNADTGLYHLTLVRWIKSFSIVPGLGNLHGRLAFNNSNFLYTALLGVGPWNGHAHNMANGLLLFMLFVQFVCSSVAFLKDKAYVSLSSLFNVITFVLLLFITPQLWYLDISSPNPDFPVFILGIVLAASVFALFEAFESGKYIGYYLFLVAFIATVGLVIKLSFLALGMGSVLLAIALFLIKNKNNIVGASKKVLVWAGVPMLIGLVPWMIRSVVTSGYLVYPCPLFSFPFDWKIPYDRVAYMATEIRGWARADMLWQELSENWAWFWPWVHKITRTSNIMIPVLIALLSLTIIFFCHKKKKIIMGARLFLLVPVLALVYWFIMAPDPRFAGSTFLILGSSSLTVAVMPYLFFKRFLVKVLPVLVPTLFLCFVLLGGKGNFVRKILREKNIQEAFSSLYLQTDNRYFYMLARGWVPEVIDGFYQIPKAPLRKFVTNSGLLIYASNNKINGQFDGKLWNAPLPCSPYLEARLALRDKNNMSSGVYLQENR